jgi:hypothetical protein
MVTSYFTLIGLPTPFFFRGFDPVAPRIRRRFFFTHALQYAPAAIGFLPHFSHSPALIFRNW